MIRLNSLERLLGIASNYQFFLSKTEPSAAQVLNTKLVFSAFAAQNVAHAYLVARKLVYFLLIRCTAFLIVHIANASSFCKQGDFSVPNSSDATWLLTFLGWNSYLTQCWNPFPLTFIEVNTRQLPTKWAEYPTPLLVLKLKSSREHSLTYQFDIII